MSGLVDASGKVLEARRSACNNARIPHKAVDDEVYKAAGRVKDQLHGLCFRAALEALYIAGEQLADETAVIRRSQDA